MSTNAVSSDESTAARCVAYKLGGSLFDLPDLADRIRHQWQTRPDTVPLLIVGGGAAADVVRDWDRTFQLGDEAAHWLAIDSLDLSANLLSQLLPELQLVRNRQQLELAQAAGRPSLLCVGCFVKWLETQPARLPHRWDVTSDSIAAAVAVAWNAAELVLLKSCEISGQSSLDELAAQGLVDPHFPAAAAGLRRITWLNLRAAAPHPVAVDTTGASVEALHANKNVIGLPFQGRGIESVNRPQPPLDGCGVL